MRLFRAYSFHDKMMKGKGRTNLPAGHAGATDHAPKTITGYFLAPNDEENDGSDRSSESETENDDQEFRIDFSNSDVYSSSTIHVQSTSLKFQTGII